MLVRLLATPFRAGIAACQVIQRCYGSWSLMSPPKHAKVSKSQIKIQVNQIFFMQRMFNWYPILKLFTARASLTWTVLCRILRLFSQCQSIIMSLMTPQMFSSTSAGCPPSALFHLQTQKNTYLYWEFNDTIVCAQTQWQTAAEKGMSYIWCPYYQNWSDVLQHHRPLAAAQAWPALFWSIRDSGRAAVPPAANTV